MPCRHISLNYLHAADTLRRPADAPGAGSRKHGAPCSGLTYPPPRPSAAIRHGTPLSSCATVSRGGCPKSHTPAAGCHGPIHAPPARAAAERGGGSLSVALERRRVRRGATARRILERLPATAPRPPHPAHQTHSPGRPACAPPSFPNRAARWRYRSLWPGRPPASAPLRHLCRRPAAPERRRRRTGARQRPSRSKPRTSIMATGMSTR